MANRFLLWDRRGLGEVARPRAGLGRLAGLSDHAVELRPESEYLGSRRWNRSNRDRSRPSSIFAGTCTGALHAKGRQDPLWRADDGAANSLPQSPVASQEKEETVRLIPYAAAKLRVTAFAQLESD